MDGASHRLHWTRRSNSGSRPDPPGAWPGQLLQRPDGSNSFPAHTPAHATAGIVVAFAIPPAGRGVVTQAFVRAGLIRMSPPRVFVLILHSTNSNNTNCWTVCSARRPLTLIAMPKRKITKKRFENYATCRRSEYLTGDPLETISVGPFLTYYPRMAAVH